MLHNQTLDRLKALRLEGLVQALEEQRRQPDITDLDFEDRLGLLVERQWLWKENRSLALRLKRAQLKLAATLEDINYHYPRGLKRAQVDQLRTNDWIGRHTHCLVTGPTGCGKTYIACALAHQACRDGYRTRYWSAPKLFRELQSAHADGSLPKRLKQLARTDLLVVDDLGIASATPKQFRDLLEVLDDRVGQGSMLITSQFPVEEWHGLMGDATIADALMDRLVHQAYRIELDGESIRKTQALKDPHAKPADRKGTKA